MPERTLADVQGEIQEALDSKRIDCAAHPKDDQADIYCDACANGELDPAYDALRALVNNDIVARSIRAQGYSGPSGPGGDEAVRYWLAEPNGSNEGALIKAMNDWVWKPTKPVPRTIKMYDDLNKLLLTDGDTRIPAWEAVLEWLKDANAQP